MPKTLEDELAIDSGTPPLYLTRAEQYMLFAIAEHEEVPERTALQHLIEQAYSMLGINVEE